MNRLKQIEERLNTIRSEELGKDDANLDALEKEIEDLQEERKGIQDKIQKRKDLENNIATNNDLNIIKNFKDDGDNNMDKRFTEESPEYRSAFLNKLRRIDLTENEERAYKEVVEERAFTTGEGSAGAIIPSTTQNRIVEVIEQHAPLLGEINLMRVPGGVTIPIEDIVEEATSHDENAQIDIANDTLTNANLFAYEITKLLRISKSVTRMSLSAFETWLASNLGRSLAAKITSGIINGTGNGEAAGISTLTFNDKNSITATGTLTSQNVFNLIGILPGQFDTNGKFLMSKKTLFNDFAPLENNGKNKLVRSEGRTYYIQGYPVMLDERIPLHEAYLGDFRAGYYGNMPEAVNVVNQFDIDTNSYKYLGAAMFDGKPVIPRAFVKLNQSEGTEGA